MREVDRVKLNYCHYFQKLFSYCHRICDINVEIHLLVITISVTSYAHPLVGITGTVAPANVHEQTLAGITGTVASASVYEQPLAVAECIY